jgi:hypothetical protein
LHWNALGLRIFANQNFLRPKGVLSLSQYMGKEDFPHDIRDYFCRRASLESFGITTTVGHVSNTFATTSAEGRVPRPLPKIKKLSYKN